MSARARGGLLVAITLASAAALAPSCTALVGDFNEGLGGGPPTAASSSATGSGGASSSSAAASTGGTGGAPCMTTPCSYTAPQCCPSGDHCTVDDATDKPVCTPAGTKQPGESCSTDAECAGPTWCSGVGPGFGECRLFCTIDANCPAGTPCGVAIYGVSFMVLATACGDPCDPSLAGVGCPANAKCDLDINENLHSSAAWITRCFDAGNVTPGATCASYTDCVAGSGCFALGPGYACQKYCAFADPAPNHGCPGATSCKDIDPPAYVVGKHYGLCK